MNRNMRNLKLNEQATAIFHIEGDNMALVVGESESVIITTGYPIADRNEVKGLLECHVHGQPVPSTSFCVYQRGEGELAQEAYEAMRLWN